MKIKDMMGLIWTALDRWAQDNAGGAYIASDLEHAWRLCQSNTNTPRVIIVYAGENIRGDFSVAAINRRVDREFSVVVSRGRGLQIDRAQTLTDPANNARPLFDLVEEVRDICRNLWATQFVEDPVDFKNVLQWDSRPYIVDAYCVNFSIADDLPDWSPTPTDGPSPQQTIPA